MDYNAAALAMHEKNRGKLTVQSLVPVRDRDALSTAYTPGVAEPCRHIAKNPEDVYKYTLKGRTVAVVTNGTAVLGLGNIGPEAGLPVMEGKCALFKEFGGVDAFPICLNASTKESRPSRRPSAASTWRTSAAPNALPSRKSWSATWTSRFSTTTSTAQPSSCWPVCSTR